MNTLRHTMATQLIRQHKDLPEHQITDLYEKQRLLGQGIYGCVQQVRCKRTGETLALKSLSKRQVSFENFKRELNYSYFLSVHPSIITTYTVTFQTRTQWAFLQELSPLGTILETVPTNIGIGMERSKAVIGQIADALNFIHANNLCHRDVSPQNVLVFNQFPWMVKLCDFGLTCKKKTNVRKRSANNALTPPEICGLLQNECYLADAKADVWQSGITLYYLLNGALPWACADSKLDKNYKTFLKWRHYKRTSLPGQWQRFNTKLLKLFRKLFNPLPEERCSITEIHKYLKADWTSLTTSKEPSHEDSQVGTCSDKCDRQNAEAKAALREYLNKFGIQTKVSKSYRKERVEDWLKLHVDHVE